MTTELTSVLRERRLQRHLRQMDVAAKTRLLGGPVSKLTVSDLENGRLDPTRLRPNQMTALQQVLGLTADEWSAFLVQPMQAASGQPLTLEPHVWLRTRRLSLGIRQSDLSHRTQQRGGAISERQCAHLQNGRLAPSRLTAVQVQALRHTLEITDAEWEALVANTERTREEQ